MTSELDDKRPKLVFLSGKTSTGKTTLSNKLKDRYNCAVIELDAVIRGLDSPQGINKFLEAYQRRDHPGYVRNFVDAVQGRIRKELESHNFVIIEGAIVNSKTLQEIIDEWSDSFLFIYLDIKNIDVYVRNLKSRFIATSQGDGNGLPVSFWRKFKPKLLRQYYVDRQITPEIRRVIKSYALDSMDESAIRLAKFSSKFDHILKIEVYDDIDQEVAEYIAEASRLLPDLPGNITFVRDNSLIIPGNGTGGTLIKPTVLGIGYDPAFEDKQKLSKHLRATVLHECFHAVQGWSDQAPTMTPKTLLEDGVLEGAATVFERQFGLTSPPWSRYADDETMKLWLTEVKSKDLDPNSNEYIDYKFGSVGGVKWMLYKLGTWIVDKALARNPEISIIDLATKRPEVIIKLAGI